jgi:pimeloyl-ACP methyl ester carboxylesterase
MATFVLVHGAWSGGWGWTRVAGLLRKGGHDVFVPTLTGLGERAHLAQPGITLATHVQDVLGVFDFEDLEDVVLVGHSYGGMVITAVSGLRAARIRTLVYLDAFVPQSGQSLFDLAGKGARANFIENQKATPGLVSPAAIAATPDDEELAAIRRRKLRSQPLLTLTEPVTLDGSQAQIRNRTYIWAEKSPGFERFHQQAKADPAWKTRTIATGHVVMLEDPPGLARLLLEEA